MKPMVTFLSEPVVVALGWTLLHALWQGFALVLPAAIAMYLLRRRASYLRYGIGVGTLLAQVMASVVTFSMYYQPVQSAFTLGSRSAVATQVAALSAVRWQQLTEALPWHIQFQRLLETYLPEIVTCWLLGVGVLLVRLIGGWVYVQRLKTIAVQPVSSQLTATLNRLSQRLNLRQRVQLLESARVQIPMVIGAFTPVILLPMGLVTGLSARELEAVLAHELAHVKRFDYAVNLLQSAVEVLFFFHPALWWLSARVREERENCCDDLAVQACGNAHALAQALARVEEFSHTPALALALASRRKQLLERVRRMLGVPARPVVSNGHLIGLTLATLLLFSASVYAIQQQDEPGKPSQKAAQTKTPRTEFSIIDQSKVDYIIWQGQKLPAKRVERLQQQLDQIIDGTLGLENVTSKEDHEILRMVIMSRQPLEADPEVTAVAMVQDDFHLADIGLIQPTPDLAITTTLPDIAIYNPSPDTLDDRLRELHNRQIDSLARLEQQIHAKLRTLNLQAEKHQFRVEEFERKMETLNWKREKLHEQRRQQIERNMRQLQETQTAKQKLSEADIEKRINEGELRIKESEKGIEELNQQIESMENELRSVRQPLDELEKQMDGLSRLQEEHANKMSRMSENLVRGMPYFPGHPEIEVHGVMPPPPARAARPARVPRPGVAPRPGAVLAPGQPVAPVLPVGPATTIRPGVAAPAASPKPRATPKANAAPTPKPAPAVTPKPPKD
ncbi:hypothetical protein GCM10023189_53200 [Nibrella saemangeumensis]|uniref:Peptidase M56 domain-containing protein n=1 Tax=Nibrella saemangeumensis TaxID=1084526 RepID=A0ABP8NLA3_9BACT